MIPGANKPYTNAAFRRGMVCEVVGCSRRARHQWAYPCAINTTLSDPSKTAWIALCDDCDVEMNRALLRIVGTPEHVLDDLIASYKLIQADGAFT